MRLTLETTSFDQVFTISLKCFIQAKNYASDKSFASIKVTPIAISLTLSFRKEPKIDLDTR